MSWLNMEAEISRQFVPASVAAARPLALVQSDAAGERQSARKSIRRLSKTHQR
jgi:hypothetical protein